MDIENQKLLEAINIRNLPIGWESLSNLGKLLSQFKDEGTFSDTDLADIKPPKDTYPALPMIASIIANHNNGNVPLYLPSGEDIRKMKPYLVTLERLIGKISPRLSHKFTLYYEKKGNDTILGIGKGAIEIIQIFDTFENPREQFLSEITLLYVNLQKPVIEEGIFFDGEASIEDKISKLLIHIQGFSSRHDWFNARSFPLTFKLLKRFTIGELPDDAHIAGAELMSAIEIFLRQRGVKGITKAPLSQEFDLFDFDTWKRGLAEMFYAEKLEKVKRVLPDVLLNIEQILPVSNFAFKQSAYFIAENICVLNDQGVSPEVIAQNIFKKSN